MPKTEWEYHVIETNFENADLDADYYVVVFSSLDYQTAYNEKERRNELAKLLASGKFYNLIRERKEER